MPDWGGTAVPRLVLLWMIISLAILAGKGEKNGPAVLRAFRPSCSIAALSQLYSSLEPISQFSKCAVFLGFDVHGPSGGCKSWFQKAEFKKDLTRLRSEAKTSLFF